MIFFQVSLNFNPAKEILKMRCQIYILMKKVIILSLKRKKRVGNESYEKQTTEAVVRRYSSK